jgi:hypothetical protein
MKLILEFYYLFFSCYTVMTVIVTNLMTKC